MARLNARPSTVAGSRVGSAAPTPTPNIDQENHDPRATRDKSIGPVDASSRTSLPTPSSDDPDMARGQKRKRTNTHADATQACDIPEDMDPGDLRFTRYYDPNQDAETRRQIKRKSRALQREFNENREQYLRSNGRELQETITRANQNFKSVKQTSDATLDARLLVDVSGLAKKQAASMVLGDTSTGLDVDAFLGKCITYMKHGGPLNAAGENGEPQLTQTQTQRRSRRDPGESDDEDDDAVDLDFEVLGRSVCFPYNVRPACPSFLLGPLSVEKKVRVQTQRRARNGREALGREVQPEQLGKDDMTHTDQNALTAICTTIQRQLHKHCNRAMKAIQRIEAAEGQLTQERQKELCQQYGVTMTGGPSLFEFVVNPHSFGQTVENLFYVSFLIKEGNAGVEKDPDGMPTLIAAKPIEDVEEQRRRKTTRNQAIFSLDYATWKELIEAFDIKEPMIAHRNEEQATQVGSRGWYA